ncbi:hypothetical protein HKX48_002746, partial [Thoreauomyces humboldtii]
TQLSHFAGFNVAFPLVLKELDPGHPKDKVIIDRNQGFKYRVADGYHRIAALKELEEEWREASGKEDERPFNPADLRAYILKASTTDDDLLAIGAGMNASSEAVVATTMPDRILCCMNTRKALEQVLGAVPTGKSVGDRLRATDPHYAGKSTWDKYAHYAFLPDTVTPVLDAESNKFGGGQRAFTQANMYANGKVKEEFGLNRPRFTKGETDALGIAAYMYLLCRYREKTDSSLPLEEVAATVEEVAAFKLFAANFGPVVIKEHADAQATRLDEAGWWSVFFMDLLSCWEPGKEPFEVFKDLTTHNRQTRNFSEDLLKAAAEDGKLGNLNVLWRREREKKARAQAAGGPRGGESQDVSLPPAAEAGAPAEPGSAEKGPPTKKRKASETTFELEVSPRILAEHVYTVEHEDFVSYLLGDEDDSTMQILLEQHNSTEPLAYVFDARATPVKKSITKNLVKKVHKRSSTAPHRAEVFI